MKRPITIAVVALALWGFCLSADTSVWQRYVHADPGAKAKPATVSEGTITLPTLVFDKYSYAPSPFRGDTVDLGYPNLRTDRYRLRWDSKRAEDKVWKTVVLENEYLKVTLLPELGGRVFDAVFKATGEHVFFHEPKLSPFELFGCGREWMFATGGIRFEFPTWGHDPNTEEKWDHATRRHDDGRASATFTRTDVRTGIRCKVNVALDPGRSWIRINPEVSNPNPRPTDASFWIITGMRGTRGIEFILPTYYVIGHGGEFTTRWPVINGVDNAYFQNWRDMNSFFALNWKSGFSGLYDHKNRKGIVRCAPPVATPGLKLWGSRRMGERYYVSLYGGLTQTMEEYVRLAPGEVRKWEEFWYPIAKTDGLTAANREAAISLRKADGRITVKATATRLHTGAKVSIACENANAQMMMDLAPGFPASMGIKLPEEDGIITVRVETADGRLLIDCTKKIADVKPMFVMKKEPPRRRRRRR